jgi:hypothetical protein
LVLDDTFYDGETTQHPVLITYKDYLTTAKNDTSFLVSKINEDVQGKRIRG